MRTVMYFELSSPHLDVYLSELGSLVSYKCYRITLLLI